MALLLGRAVRQVEPDRVGPRRMLWCKIGMGGTASLLLWTISYDAIVYGMWAAVGAASPTFVDDLAALVTGPKQAARALLFLLAAGHCAGLLTENHRCGHVSVRGLTDEVRRLLEPLPVVQEPRGRRG